MVQVQNGSNKRKILIFIGLYGLMLKAIIRIVKKYHENEKIVLELDKFIKFFLLIFF